MKNQLKNLPERIEPGETVAGVEICPPGDWPNGKIVQRSTSGRITDLTSPEGALHVQTGTGDPEQIFARCVVTAKRISQVGCCVVVQYTIEG